MDASKESPCEDTEEKAEGGMYHGMNTVTTWQHAVYLDDETPEAVGKAMTNKKFPYDKDKETYQDRCQDHWDKNRNTLRHEACVEKEPVTRHLRPLPQQHIFEQIMGAERTYGEADPERNSGHVMSVAEADKEEGRW